MYPKYVCKIEFWSSTNIFITNQLASMILAPPLSIKGRHSTHKQLTHPQCRIADGVFLKTKISSGSNIILHILKVASGFNNYTGWIISSRIQDSDEDNEIEEFSFDEEAKDGVVLVPAVLRFHDVGYLEFDQTTKLSIIPQPLRDELITLGSIPFQHRGSLSSVAGERSITASWFKRRLANGEEVNRSWLLYSPINKAAYCFCCLLFTSSSSNSRSSFELTNGFNKWRKPEKLQSHENSLGHRRAFTTWKEAERRIIDKTGIDVQVQAQIQLEKQRWRDILKRILTCIKFLVSQNLALRGHEEHLHKVRG